MALAAVGRGLGDDLLAADEVEPVEALAELAGLGVSHVDPVADPDPDRDLTEERRLHLAGTLELVEVEPGRKPGLRQPIGRRSVSSQTA